MNKHKKNKKDKKVKKDKKNNNKSKNNIIKKAQNLTFARILFIDKMISEGSYPSAPKIAKEYEGVSVITIKRDIDYMRSMLNAPIEYDKTRKGYYYGDKTFRLPFLFTNEEEIFSGSIAIKLLYQYRGTPIYRNVKNIFDYFNKVVEKSKDKDFEKRILFIEEYSPSFPEDVWNILIKAIKENRYVEFSYKSAWRKEEGHGYHIAPYQIVSKAGVWYFAGYSKRRKSVSLYCLHRITSINLTSETFEMPKNYKYLNDKEISFGVFKGAKRKCKIRFYNESAAYISERKFAEDQRIKKMKDGSIIATFSSGQIYEILRFVLSQGSNAIPLKPKDLVEEWKNNIKIMHKNSKKL